MTFIGLPSRETVMTDDENNCEEDAPLLSLSEIEAGIPHDIIKVEAKDVGADVVLQAEIEKVKAEKKDTFISDVIYSLVSLRFPEEEARVLWQELLEHKWDMSDKLARNVGVGVAAFDYFKNIRGDLTDEKIVSEAKFVETARLAIRDPLTGLYNHRYFQDSLRDMIRQADETGRAFSVMMIDIDHFKKYNDTNGHVAGDVALCEVARVLELSVRVDEEAGRSADLVARYGGEEFVIVFRNKGKDESFEVAERVLQNIADTEIFNEQVLPGKKLTISAGLSEYPQDAKVQSELIQFADQCLYYAKHLGGNRVAKKIGQRRRFFWA